MYISSSMSGGIVYLRPNAVGALIDGFGFTRAEALLAVSSLGTYPVDSSTVVQERIAQFSLRTMAATRRVRILLSH
jgi:hypothetical protein